MFKFLTATRITILALAMICIWPPQTNAEVSVKITDEERAIFSFFKLARTAPDYPTWIKASEIYKSAPSSQIQEQVYEQESLRLKWGFGTHDIDEHPLKIRTKILLQLQKDKKSATLNFKFLHSADEESPIFPYPYGNEWIALIIDDLQKFVSITLSNEEFKRLNADLEVNAVYNGSLKIRIQPTHADNNRPLKVNGSKQWLMLGKTAYLKFSYKNPETKERKVIWEYTAPWYLSDTENTLLKLLGE